MSENLVVIRTFGSLFDADEAQVDLLSAGIYSLVLADSSASIFPDPAPKQSVGLAVHQRDVAIAEAVLTPRPHPE